MTILLDTVHVILYALPQEIINMTVDDYEGFLNQRRHLMAKMIGEYYKQL